MAFLILVYHMDENGKQTNFTQKHQTPIYKKCYLRVWVCFFFVVREQDHKTPQKKKCYSFPIRCLFPFHLITFFWTHKKERKKNIFKNVKSIDSNIFIDINCCYNFILFILSYSLISLIHQFIWNNHYQERF